MVKRKIWMILVVLLISFFFVNINTIRAVDGGTCECKLKTEGLKTVGYDITNNCKTGYEPEWGKGIAGQGICKCECVLIGTEKSLETDKEVTYTDGASGGGNYNPLCSNDKGISTALGCIPVEIKDFIPWLLKYLFGIAGGIAFLLMVYGFILIATSGGDEKKMAGAKETITSAIIGLLVCIFAIFILRLIAIQILKIPGF